MSPAESQRIHFGAGMILHYAFAEILFGKTQIDGAFYAAHGAFFASVEIFAYKHRADMVIHQSFLPVR